MVCFLTALTCPKRIVKVRQAEPFFFCRSLGQASWERGSFLWLLQACGCKSLNQLGRSTNQNRRNKHFFGPWYCRRCCLLKRIATTSMLLARFLSFGCVVQFNLGRGCKSICSTELGKGTKRWGPSSRFLKSWTVYSSLFLACCLCFSFLVLFFFTGDLQKNKVLCYHTKSRDALFRYFLDVSHSSGKRQVWALVLAHLFDRKP